MAREIKAPGLEWRKRKNGDVPYWVAPKHAVKAGFKPATVNLASLIDEPERLTGRCIALSSEVQEFLAYGGERQELEFDGTLKDLLDRYETDKESDYHTLDPETQRTYSIYIRRLRNAYGERNINKVSGRDVKAWYRVWIQPQPPKVKLQHAAGMMAFAVLLAAIRFGISDRLFGCQEFQTVLRTVELEKPQPRTQVISREEVIALRTAAHQNGAPRRALAAAIQFDCVLRLYDVLGKWVPLSDPRPSAVLGYGRKWIGPKFEDISPENTITIVPSKTRKKTGKSVTINLGLCPMVQEEMALIPPDQRTGPLIINEGTGLPYRIKHWPKRWRKDADRAGLSPDKWSRDIRASANTEARAAGALTDDLAKVAAHSPAINRRVYDRETVVAFERVAQARADHVKTKRK